MDGEAEGTIFDERVAEQLVSFLNKFEEMDRLLLSMNIDIMDCNLQEVFK